MTADGRSAILRAVGEALEAQAAAPASLPDGLDLDTPDATEGARAERFCAELRALGGAAFVVEAEGCAAAIEAYLRERDVKSIAVQDAPRATRIAALVRNVDVAPASVLSTRELERVDCSLLEGRALLADTGSVLVMVTRSEDRLLPYLARTCVVVCDASSLQATLSRTALACIDEPARSHTPGEAVIITGPSRTADIEKTLVLGAHGPEALAVFIIRADLSAT